jgi:hypothetical protein
MKLYLELNRSVLITSFYVSYFFYSVMVVCSSLKCLIEDRLTKEVNRTQSTCLHHSTPKYSLELCSMQARIDCVARERSECMTCIINGARASLECC